MSLTECIASSLTHPLGRASAALLVGILMGGSTSHVAPGIDTVPPIIENEVRPYHSSNTAFVISIHDPPIKIKEPFSKYLSEIPSYIDRVELYHNDQQKSIVHPETNPFELYGSLDPANMLDGEHTFTVVAYDQSENKATTTVRLIVKKGIHFSKKMFDLDQKAPLIVRFDPFESAIAGSSVQFEAADDGTGIAEVRVYTDGKFEFEKMYEALPSVVDVAGLFERGTHLYRIEAEDFAGNTGAVEKKFTFGK